MKVKECVICGCDRRLMIQADIEENNKTQYKLRWMCFPCLLRYTNMIDSIAPDAKLNYDLAMEIQEGSILNEN